jgi:hypothetical protein
MSTEPERTVLIAMRGRAIAFRVTNADGDAA